MAKCPICGEHFKKGDGVTDYDDVSRPEYCSDECYEKGREKADAQLGGFVGKARRFRQKVGILIIVAFIIWMVMKSDDSENEPKQERHENKAEKVQN